jgi:hypothetical protein
MTRSSLAVVVLVASATLVASCVGVLKLDDYSGALEALCQKIAECYGADYYADCRERTEARLEGASAEEREDFLATFADSYCLESCINARACLDEQPICARFGDGCAMPEQCCGFTHGSGTCAGSSCCKPLGVACTADTECCVDELGKPVACIASVADEGQGLTTCGGATCVAEGQECAGPGQCCGELRCHPLDHTCSQCFPEMTPCTQPFDCCSRNCVQFVDGPPGTESFCGPPECTGDGVDCEKDADCCSQICSEVGESRVCSWCYGGLPDGAICHPPLEGDGTDPPSASECCSGYCDPVFSTCGYPPCEPAGGPCDGMFPCCTNACKYDDNMMTGTCCGFDYEYCEDDSWCCNGSCVDFTCTSGQCGEQGTSCIDDFECCQKCDVPNSQCCNIIQCHSVCFQGTPLDDKFCEDPMNPTPEAGCIQTVCDDPQYADCCCVEWTDACVAKAMSDCMVLCPI